MSATAGRAGLAWRAFLVVVASGASVAGAPAVLAAPLVLVAAATTAERVARHRRRGVLDLLVCAVGGTVCAAILLGAVLNVVPSGLTGLSWAIGAAVLGLTGLGCCLGRPVPPSLAVLARAAGPGASRRGLWWVAASALVVGGTLVVSVQSAYDSQPPPLQLSAGTATAGTVEIRVDSGVSAGRYQLDQVTATSRTVLVPGFDLRPDTTAVFSVSVPAGVRTTVELHAVGVATPLRQLIFDNSPTREGF